MVDTGVFYEKRLAKRKNTIFLLLFTFTKPYSTKILPKKYEGIIKNVSETGLYFESTSMPLRKIKNLLRNKIIFSIEFHTKNKKITATAELRWYKGNKHYLESHKAGYGLKFRHISEEHRRILAGFVK